MIQTKPTVGPAGDAYEREADAVAASVVRFLRADTSITPDTRAEPTQRTMSAFDGDGGDGRGDGDGDGDNIGGRVGRIRRTTGQVPGPTPHPDGTRVRRAAIVGDRGGDLDADTSRMLQSSQSGGVPLDARVRAPMETAFGADFSGVRVHTDPTSTELNTRIQAKAFTTGSHIYFRDGAPDIARRVDQELLAHELTHVVQQGSAGIRRAPSARETHVPARVSPDPTRVLRRHADRNSLIDRMQQWPSQIARQLMAGVLDETSLAAAAERIYLNMFANMDTFGWTYKASFGSGAGAALIDGKSTVGMCETYRNAFRYMLEQYFLPLVDGYEPLSGALSIEEGQDLVSAKFVTKPGLALLGRRSGYNVTRVVDGDTGVEQATERYLFNKHWQLKVNGKVYDPLFDSSAGQNAIEWIVTVPSTDYYVTDDPDIAFVTIPTAGPTAGGEFAGQYLMVTNAKAYGAGIADTPSLKQIRTGISDLIGPMVNEYGKSSQGSRGWEKSARRAGPGWAERLRELKEAAVTELAKPGPEAGAALIDQSKQTTLRGLLDDIRFRTSEAARAMDKLADKQQTPAQSIGPQIKTTIDQLTALLTPVG